MLAKVHQQLLVLLAFLTSAVIDKQSLVDVPISTALQLSANHMHQDGE